MDFEEKIKMFTSKISEKLKHIDTEETTKTALILPFLNEVMGYDTTNPAEVKAEYTADVGAKKGEKIDLAVLNEGEEIIMIECKSANTELSIDHISQLYKVYDGVITQNVREKFYKIIKNEFKEVINEKVELRLNNALEKNNSEDMIEESNDDGIVTTKEEYEGYYIIKSIASKVVDPDRVFIRDFKSYCTVILDDNNHYPLARMYFNNLNNLKLGLFDKFEKRESGSKIIESYNINNVSEIYNFEENIIKTVNVYLREIKKKK